MNDPHIVNVRDFGAKGDGFTDDTAAIRAAYDHAHAIGATVAFDPGTYRVTDAVDLRDVDTKGPK